jgi:hypothetical protein
MNGNDPSIVEMEEATPWLARPAVLREAAAELGYLYLPGLIDRAPLDALRGDLLAVCRTLNLLADAASVDNRARDGARLFPYSGEDWLRLQRDAAVLDSFRALRLHPALLETFGTLFGSSPEPDRGNVCRVFLPAAPEVATPPHQDLFFLEKTGFERPDRIWGAWLPVVDCPRELGPLAVLPGSHREGLRVHGLSDARGRSIEVSDGAVWAASDLGTGDVVLVSCLTVHRALPNRTADRIRLSVDFRYEPG